MNVIKGFLFFSLFENIILQNHKKYVIQQLFLAVKRHSPTFDYNLQPTDYEC